MMKRCLVMLISTAIFAASLVSPLIATATEPLPDFKKWEEHKSISCIRSSGNPANFKMENWSNGDYIVSLITTISSGETWTMFRSKDFSMTQYYLGKHLVDDRMFMETLKFVFNGEDFRLLNSFDSSGKSESKLCTVAEERP
ncbi:MAG: hypothetical protein HZC04_01075 [Candidatus Lloydbacteria bacterium]|nr:hypothetical protein [Candidatus Lloydbacteria bacterium]